MKYLQRAIKTITRKYLYAIILFFSVLFFSIFIASPIILNRTLVKAEEKIIKLIRPSMKIALDMDVIYGENPNHDDVLNITVEQIEEIGNLPQVKYYDYSTSLEMYSLNYYRVGKETKNIHYSGETALQKKIREEKEVSSMTLKGIQYSNILDIDERDIELIAGSSFSVSDIVNGNKKIVISDEYAAQNQIEIGDIVTFSYEIVHFETGKIYKKIDVALEVIGIYKVNNHLFQSNLIDTSYRHDDVYSNTIYVPIKVMQEILTEKTKIQKIYNVPNAGRITYTPKFILYSNDLIDSFKDSAGPIIGKYYKINESIKAYSDIVPTINTIQILSYSILISALIIFVFFLVLIMVLFLNDRKQEFFVYLRLGETKVHLIFQVFLEVIIISILAFSIGLLISNTLMKKYSLEPINSELINTVDNCTSSFMGPATTYKQLKVEEYINYYHVELDSNIIIHYCMIGFGSILIATLLSSIYFVKFDRNNKKVRWLQ